MPAEACWRKEGHSLSEAAWRTIHYPKSGNGARERRKTSGACKNCPTHPTGDPTYTVSLREWGARSALDCGGKRQRHAAFGRFCGRAGASWFASAPRVRKRCRADACHRSPKRSTLRLPATCSCKSYESRRSPNPFISRPFAYFAGNPFPLLGLSRWRTWETQTQAPPRHRPRSTARRL